MPDFRLPFGAGAESSSVSFDPRRQAAPVDDEITQVTQSGGRAPAPTVRNSIETQFGAGQPAARSDDFTKSTNSGSPPIYQGYVRDVPRAVAQDLEKKYQAKRAVWKDITKKQADKALLKKKAWQTNLIKQQTQKKLAFRQRLESISKQAVAQRAKIQNGIRAGEIQRGIRTEGVKVDTKVNDIRTTDAVADPQRKGQL